MRKNLLATEELLVVLAFGFVAALMLFFYVPDFQSIGLATSPLLKAGTKLGVSSPSVNPVIVDGPSIGIGGPAGSTCGNNILDAHEQCDGIQFRLYGNGVNQCTAYDSVAFTSGNLICFGPNDPFGRNCQVSAVACDGPVNADFLVYKRVSDSLWQEVNLLTQELEVNTQYFFDGTVSVGENYENAALSTWNFGAGLTNEGIMISREFYAPGTYGVTLTLNDGQGNSDQVAKNVVVGSGGVCSGVNGSCDSSCTLSQEELLYSAGNSTCFGGTVCCVPAYIIGASVRTVNVNGVNVAMQVVLQNGFEQYADLKLNGAVKRIWSGNLNQDLYFGGCSVRVLQSNWSGDPPLFVSMVTRVWGCSQPINICGNLLLQQGEQCDGPVLGIENCQLAGFDNGNISCNTSTCTLNTSSCTSVCGNGEKSPTEQCDDAGLCADSITLCTSSVSCAENGSSGPCTPRSGDGCNAQCVTEHCGDGTINNAINGVASETCDDHNLVNGDGCNSQCSIEYCGDGAVNNNNSEECDDGNNVNDDGCSSVCDIEQDPVCGNGALEEGEQCDDDNTNNNDGCSSTCQIEGPQSCGNGVISLGEQCDDGGVCQGDGQTYCTNGLVCGQAGVPGPCVPVSGDGCSAACQNEYCGDGIVNNADNGVPTEQCDDGNQNNNDACSNTCQIQLVAGVCGDGVLNLFEECEIGNLGEFGNGVNQCDNYSSAFTSGNLLCFQSNDPISRGCTINYLSCDGPLNADFKIYGYVTPTTFEIINPLMEDLSVGEQYVFDSAYSVGETSANWDFGAGSLENGIAVFYTFDSPGVYSVVLTAFDGEGGSDIQIKQVTVTN